MRRLAVRQEPHVGGIAPHEQEHRRQHEHEDAQREDVVRMPPADVLDQVLRHRREHDAARRDARGRDAECEPAPPDEPPRDRAVRRQRADARRAECDRSRHRGVEPPERRRARDERVAEREREHADDLHRPRTVAVDETADPETVERRRDLHRRVRDGHAATSTERLGERREEDAPRVEEKPDVDGERDERRRDDPPAVEDSGVSACRDMFHAALKPFECGVFRAQRDLACYSMFRAHVAHF